MHLLFMALSAAILHATLASPHLKLGVEKLRRGSSGLVPFPRVGRGGARTREVAPDGLDIDSEMVQKRPMYAHPRIGRGDLAPWFKLSPQNQLQELETVLLELGARGRGGGASAARGGYVKRDSDVTDSGSMWFGPRLGRSSEKETDYDDNLKESSTSGRGYFAGSEMTINRKRRQSD